MVVEVTDPSMIDISQKPTVHRRANAKGTITLRQETIQRIRLGKIEKGDPLNVAKIAAILAAKKTSSIVPLCHNILLTSIEIKEQIDEKQIIIEAEVTAAAKTGVEMEALTAVSVALLTVWDMVKQYEKDENGQYPTTVISDINVLEKDKGGKDE